MQGMPLQPGDQPGSFGLQEIAEFKQGSRKQVYTGRSIHYASYVPKNNLFTGQASLKRRRQKSEVYFENQPGDIMKLMHQDGSMVSDIPLTEKAMPSSTKNANRQRRVNSGVARIPSRKVK